MSKAEEFFKRRQKGHVPGSLGRILDKVPKGEPVAGDELPEGLSAEILEAIKGFREEPK